MLEVVRADALRRIRTERLILEPVNYENVRRLWQLMRAPHLRDHQDIPRVPFERFVERLDKRSPRLMRRATGRFEWIIQLRSTHEALGWVSIRFQDRQPHRGELGYSILAPFRRCGYATEAVAALTDEVFAADVVDYVDAYCMPANLGSRGVLIRAGLRETQRLANGAVIRGRPVDILRFEASSAGWRRSQPLRRFAQDQARRSDNLPHLTLREEHKAER